MTMHLKTGGSWHTIDAPYVNVGGTWKTVREVQIKHGGSWRHVHTTPHTEYNLGSYVLEQNIGEDESGTYTIPTGQGIAYIQVYVEGQAGGGGGGAYTPNYWACSGGAPVTSSTTSNTAVGGYGGLGGTITAIHRVYDGDYVSWTGYSDGPANGGGGAPYLLNIFPMTVATSHPSPGTYTGPSGDNGFMVQCNIRNSSGTSKSQLWAGGGRGGPGATLTLNSTCIQSSLVGFNVTSGANGGYAANGQAYNQIVAGSGSQSVVQGDGDLARGTPGTGNASGGSAQNIGQVKIKLYTPRKY